MSLPLNLVDGSLDKKSRAKIFKMAKKNGSHYINNCLDKLNSELKSIIKIVSLYEVFDLNYEARNGDYDIIKKLPLEWKEIIRTWIEQINFTIDNIGVDGVATLHLDEKLMIKEKILEYQSDDEYDYGDESYNGNKSYNGDEKWEIINLDTSEILPDQKNCSKTKPAEKIRHVYKQLHKFVGNIPFRVWINIMQDIFLHFHMYNTRRSWIYCENLLKFDECENYQMIEKKYICPTIDVLFNPLKIYKVTNGEWRSIKPNILPNIHRISDACRKLILYRECEKLVVKFYKNIGSNILSISSNKLSISSNKLSISSNKLSINSKSRSLKGILRNYDGIEPVFYGHGHKYTYSKLKNIDKWIYLTCYELGELLDNGLMISKISKHTTLHKLIQLKNIIANIFDKDLSLIIIEYSAFDKAPRTLDQKNVANKFI